LRLSLVLAIAVLSSLIAPGPTAVAAEAPSPITNFDPASMAFPVGGSDFRVTDSFGDCRDGCARSHEGVDIMAPKGVPVYAAGDGIADWVSTTQEDCCRLQIDHGDGWSTRYIHLNDDVKNEDGTYRTDDTGWGIVEGIVDGTPIARGQLIGWVGDSGNASEGVSHLHFELRKDGVAIDSYAYLQKALGVLVSHFTDIASSTHRANIDKIYEDGITKGCNPPSNTLFCPQRSITRGEMAAFISRALGLTETTGSVPFDDVAATTFEGDIDRIVTAGIGFGCDADSYCPDRPLLRDEMAEMLVRAFGYDNPDGVDHFLDDDGSQFEESINKLASHDITLGCNPPANDMFCPDRTLTRGEMASFFTRAKGL
jgi:hypothetical protein